MEFKAFSIICLLILSAGLAKNLEYRKVDKLVFKQMGEYVVRKEKNNKKYVPVLTSSNTREIAFYSNRNNEAFVLPGIIGLNFVNRSNYKVFVESVS